MYYPYFRGKQFELIAIREMANLLAKRSFVPIIEPVRESLRGLEVTLETVKKVGGQAIVIVNPKHGDHNKAGDPISSLLKEKFRNAAGISAGILLRNEMTVKQALDYHDIHSGHNPAFIHAGFTDPRDLAENLRKRGVNATNIFNETYSSLLYRRHFAETKRILLRDGFKRSRNADYPFLEEFSDLHITYQDMGMNGFGDFLIVGDEYSEGGGPAYAVAIHLTFIDPSKENVMYIYHFVSKTKHTPTDPAGKFAEALGDLVAKAKDRESHIAETSALREFMDLHAKGHFPGLGYIKKLSMKHHVETIAGHLMPG